MDEQARGLLEQRLVGHYREGGLSAVLSLSVTDTPAGLQPVKRSGAVLPAGVIPLLRPVCCNSSNFSYYLVIAVPFEVISRGTGFFGGIYDRSSRYGHLRSRMSVAGRADEPSSPAAGSLGWKMKKSWKTSP